MCGMTGHSSKFPCPYGLCFRDSDGYWHEGENRSWKQLETMANNYNLHGNSKRSNLKRFGNVEYAPIISDNDKEKLVIEKIPPPPLHIKLGVVNHLVDVLEEEDPLGFSIFTKKYGLVIDKYHGYTYEGNETTKILKNTRSLKRMIKRNQKTNSVLKSLIAFRTFYKNL